MDYCTYLTTYKGDKMPPFYIGRTSVKRIQTGYRGSVTSKLYKQIWLEELYRNPHLFETRILTLHSTKKESAEKEEYFHKKLQVHKNPLYINQATGYGTFHTDIKGNKNPWFGKSRSGELNPMFGKTHSELTRQKMRASGQGKHDGPKSQAHKDAIRNSLIGRSLEDLHGNDQANEIRAKMQRPKSEDHKKKQSDIMKNKPKLTCPHCGKQVSSGNYFRWHDTNCKSLIKK